MKKHTYGYTLFEFSIVIVIIAAGIGSIFMMQSLLRSSHLNHILQEYDTYTKALKEFQDKFLAYPGDMTNAENMWGSDVGCPNTAANTTLKIATCNGNGDGKIGDSSSTGVQSNQYEWFRAWQQLGDAGMLSEQYSGVHGSGGVSDILPGVNVPVSSIAGAGWNIHYFQMVGADTGLWRDNYAHMIDFGLPAAGASTIQPLLTAEESLALDRKVDDGRPGRGIIRAWRTSILPNCTSNDTTQDGETYNTANTTTSCSLVFLLGF